MTKKLTGENVWLLFALLFVAYYLYLGNLFGFGISFLWFWLLPFALCICFYIYCLLRRKGIIAKPPKFFLRIFTGFWVIVLSVFIVVEGGVIWGMQQHGKADLDYILVLGAAVYGETPSVALQLRLNEALEYLQQNSLTKVICSGGQGKGENITEAEAMRRFFVGGGIDEERLILETQSLSTAENMRFSFSLITEDDANVGVLTNNFHVFRALLLARKTTDCKLYGIAATYCNGLLPHYMLREACVTVVDFFKGNI